MKKNSGGKNGEETKTPSEPPKKMSKKDLEFFGQLLNDKKETLLQELGYLEDNSLGVNAKDSGEVTNMAYHLADHATETQDREQAFLLASREGKYLNHIEDALDRVKNGTYGVCTRCKNLIPKPRLEAVPTAKMCIQCKEAAEKDKQRAMTPE